MEAPLQEFARRTYVGMQLVEHLYKTNKSNEQRPHNSRYGLTRVEDRLGSAVDLQAFVDVAQALVNVLLKLHLLKLRVE